jgi:lactoylglutathione lyase
MRLTHTRLLVNNYEECFHFYNHILNFECTWGDETSYYAQFKVGETLLALFDKSEMLEDINETSSEETISLNEVALIFAVEDVDETYNRLKPKVKFISEPHTRDDWGIRVAHFRDPNGTLIEINQNI